MEVIQFESDDIDKIVANLSESDLDALPFGAVQVDKEGVILKFNRTEAEIVGVSANVIGKNFFKDVAPCAQVPEFYGKFQKGVESGELSVIFDFDYDYTTSAFGGTKRHRARIHMKKAVVDDTFWIFAKRVL